MGIWRSGRRLFTTTALLTLLTGIFHLVGSSSPSSGPKEDVLTAQMTAFTVPMGLGMEPSMTAIFNLLSWLFGLMLLVTGITNLMIAASTPAGSPLIHRIGILNLAWLVIFTALSYYCQVLPPFISGLLTAIVAAASLAMKNE